jgi:putative PIN family toxin of toxin-antitoxin system
MKIILDSNIWISFAIGKQLSEMEYIFESPNILIFVCDKILKEVNATLLKPKLQRYISVERRNMLMELMASCSMETIYEQVIRSRDPMDNFLLDLAETVDADYLITGDKDLLVLQQHHNTVILTFRYFKFILDSENLL